MLKKFSRLSAFLFALLLVPVSAVFAAEEVAEASATSDMLHYSLLALSIITLVLMAFLSVKDNG